MDIFIINDNTATLCEITFSFARLQFSIVFSLN